MIAGVKNHQAISLHQKGPFGDSIEFMVYVEDLEPIDRCFCLRLGEIVILWILVCFPSEDISDILDRFIPFEYHGIEMIPMTVGDKHKHAEIFNLGGIDVSIVKGRIFRRLPRSRYGNIVKDEQVVFCFDCPSSMPEIPNKCLAFIAIALQNRAIEISFSLQLKNAQH